jgi:hypothetical protein
VEAVRPGQVRKAIGAAGAALAVVVAQGVLPDPWQGYVTCAAAVLGVLAVYQLPNDPPSA